MVRFYGFAHREIQMMGVDTFDAYYSCMSSIIANEQTLRLEASDYSNGKMDSKRKVFRKYDENRIPRHLVPHRQVTTKEAFKLIGKDLNG